MTPRQKFQALLAKDSRYDVEAYNFIFETLDWILKKRKKSEIESVPITARELFEGIQGYAIEEYGILALTVFESWGISSTDDFGEIISNLVKFGLLGKHPAYSPFDFHNVCDLRQAFDLVPKFHPKKRKKLEPSYVPREASKN